MCSLLYHHDKDPSAKLNRQRCRNNKGSNDTTSCFRMRAGHKKGQMCDLEVCLIALTSRERRRLEIELKSMASDSIDHSYTTKPQEKPWTPAQSMFLAGEHTAVL